MMINNDNPQQQTQSTVSRREARQKTIKRILPIVMRKAVSILLHGSKPIAVLKR